MPLRVPLSLVPALLLFPLPLPCPPSLPFPAQTLARARNLASHRPNLPSQVEVEMVEVMMFNSILNID